MNRINYKYIAASTVGFATIIVATYFSSLTLNFVSVISIGLALLGGAYSISAMALFVILKYLNPSLFQFPPEFGLFAWLIIFLSAARNIFTIKPSAWKILGPLLIFSGITAILSLISSSHISVSLMKLVSFSVGVFAVISAFSACTQKDLDFLQHYIISIYIVIIIFSAVTLLSPKNAYFLNGTGFQGILNHPQSLGTLLSPLLAALIALLIFGKVKWLSIFPIAAAIVFSFIVMSQTRTALVSVILSLTVIVSIYLFNYRKHKLWGKFKSLLLGSSILFSIIILSLVFSKSVRDQADDFIYKRGSENIEQAVSSRASGYELQFKHFIERPFLGFGFGVYPGGIASKSVRTYMGIPISAPVEKGFILTALLEETGIFGTLLFFVLIISISKRAIKTHSVAWATIFFSCLFVNVGEAVFFSVGGIGLFYWIMIGLSSYQFKLNQNIVKPQEKLKTSNPRNKIS